MLATAAWLALPTAAPAQRSVSSDPVFTVTRISGEAVEGRLVKIDSKVATIDRNAAKGDPDERGKPVELALDSIVKFARSDVSPPLPPQGSQAIFPGGDRVRVIINAAGETALDAHSRILGDLEIPLDAFEALLLAPGNESAELFTRIRSIRSTPRKSEVVWFTNGDRQECSFLGLNAKQVVVKAGGKESAIDRGNVSGIGFDPRIVRYPPIKGLGLEVGLVDGGRLGIGDAKLEKGAISGAARFGAKINIPINQVAFIRVLSERIAYLSDRLPDEAKYVDYVGPVYAYELDANCLNLPLKVRDRVYDRGIGAQSRTLLAYKLDSRARRFQAMVGVDDRAGTAASVIFRVIADGKVLFASPAVSAGEEPIAVDVEIAGSRVLILDTEFAERGNVRDYADWLEPRLILAP